MNLTENFHIHLNSLSPFRSIGAKRSSLPNKNNNNDDDYSDLISRSFDETLLRRLKTLAASSISNPPSISLSWLSQAVDFLFLTQIEARNLISKLSSSSSSSPSPDNLSALYLDDTVKLLDICNSISSDIERLRQRRLLITFVLSLLGDGSRIPAPEILRRARDSLSDWENKSQGGGATAKRRGFQTRSSPESLIRDLATRIGSGPPPPPRGKISGAERIARRAIYAVGLVTVFVAGVAMSALRGVPEIARVRAPAEFVWADSFNAIESAIYAEMKRRVSDEEGERKAVLLDEVDDVAIRVRVVREAVSDVEVSKEKLGNAVKRMETATGKLSEGLDSLSNGVNTLFDAVLCTRSGMVDHLRVAHKE